ncbi:methyl-accepting chemotaxis protein [Pseudoalteromonas citrea]|uniref:Methyl-accepting chemotaxis protein n=2 Tax=Pseudoalteromonas citrea TaxID=43655 RepID=A0AAD4FQ45_9GAMM|nr:methyl-accepting chemotaxis protein [Pseudoalteromonas citrea]KAF7764760.1 methyl-accepting chemotaxis protein [Pseudoalteromonas citrea]
MIFTSRTDRLAQASMQSKLNLFEQYLSTLELSNSGTILHASQHFLAEVGYQLTELVGQPLNHIFKGLGNAALETNTEYKIATKNKRTLWVKVNVVDQAKGLIEGANTLLTLFDVSEYKAKTMDYAGQVEAIGKSQAIIEFDLNGVIQSANDNFLTAMEYERHEVIGQHHSMFADAEYTASKEYKDFWQALKSGEFKSGEYKRLGKNAKEVWIQATYNPIFDTNNQPFKVVKYAFDITQSKIQAADYEGQLDAISKSLAVIEFNLDGTILTANENFLKVMGYTLDEIKGQHHSLFAEPHYAASAEYQTFWAKLNTGEFSSGEYKRLAKGQREVWIHASYNPIFDVNGNPFKVVKYASDITEQKQQSTNYEGQLQAISKSQAIIEFNMDGTILTANENFLKVMGYTLDEIKGQHHQLFADAHYANSHAYKEFWQKLQQGKFHSGEYQRLGKGDKDVWIQATYNPILDPSGKPVKVVKFATDITEQKRQSANFEGQLSAINKSQAVIEFDMDGTILKANDNFLNTMGYRLDEIQGKHHSLFAEPNYAASNEYSMFWQKLKLGQFDSGEYKRVGKGGKEVWIQATYNPILDTNGQPFKVVKYATDITQRKLAIRCIKEAIISLSEGHLSHNIDDDLGIEFNILKEAMNGLTRSLNSMVHEITNTSNNVYQGSQSIATDSEELSKRIERQAASLEETASTMEELTATVKQNAKSAEDVSVHADQAMSKAAQGQETVSNAVDAMSDIEGCSNRISDIIGVINEIAFQTNLLALNASVEAARAGEAGRGFAVVASEVRNLAQRSASAAKEIKHLIEDSSSAVAKGSELVATSGKRFAELTQVVQEVNSMIMDITRAGQEQSEGVAAVSSTVAQLDNLTQKNMQLVEQSTQAGQLMRQQAQHLLQQVSTFKVSDTQELLLAPEPQKMFQLVSTR